jgi:NitT/TauT family transport system permease protein
MPVLQRSGSIASSVGVLAAVLVIWEIAVRLLGVAEFTLPAPSAIVQKADWGMVLTGTGSTAVAVVLGFAVGNAAGLALAVLIAASRSVASVVYPVTLSLRSIPVIALAPFITLAFGRGLLATVIVAALIVFFPTLVNVVLGLRSVEREALELMRVLNCSPVDVFRRVRLPAAMPAFFAALRIAAPSAVLGVMIAEWVIGRPGLGQVILTQALALETPTMWGAIFASTLLAGVAFGIVALAERLLIPWAVSS